MFTFVIYKTLMPKLPRISETEWEIMNIVWDKAPISAAEIIEGLQATDASWHPRTAKTLLSRLVRKGALGFKKAGRGYLYEPLVRRIACLEAESDSFLGRLFGGSLKPMLAHMVERRKLSAKEIEELREILNQTK
jgi:BlaI family transcriptional regulator, penicillinase repressor